MNFQQRSGLFVFLAARQALCLLQVVIGVNYGLSTGTFRGRPKKDDAFVE